MHITPARVNANDRGLVVVGFSLRLGDLEPQCTCSSNKMLHAFSCACIAVPVVELVAALFAIRATTVDEEAVFPLHEADPALHAQDNDAHLGGTGTRRLLAEAGEVQGHARGAGGSFLHGVDLSRHFSYYAYEGGSGQWRWNHEVRGVLCCWWTAVIHVP